MIKKFTSRKFILSFIGTVTSIAGMIGLQDNTAAVIGCLGLLGLSILVFCITEGKVDVAAVQASVTIIDQLLDMLNMLEAENMLPTKVASTPTDPVTHAIYDTPANSTTSITVSRYSETNPVASNTEAISASDDADPAFVAENID